MNKIGILICLMALNFINTTFANEQVTQLVEAVQTTGAALQSNMENEVFNQVNQSRTANFLAPLTWSNTVAIQARNHSLNMANKIVPFGHQGAEMRFANLRSLIPYLTRFGENVAYNRGFVNPSATAVSGWLASPGHYANIMGDFNLTGVGVAKNLRGEYYFTQIFVKTSRLLNPFHDEGVNESIDENCEKCLSPIEAVSEMPFSVDLE